MRIDDLRHSKWFEWAYRIGVGIKGIDGLAELVAGLALWLSPGLLHSVFVSIIGHAHRHTGQTYHLLAEYVARLDHDLSRSGVTFLIIFLVGHGIVKLVLVYCLLKRIIWAYPYALGVLVLFLIYQIYVLIQEPLSIGMWLFTILDIVIIWLVYGEWKDLKEVKKSK